MNITDVSGLILHHKNYWCLGNFDLKHAFLFLHTDSLNTSRSPIDSVRYKIQFCIDHKKCEWVSLPADQRIGSIEPSRYDFAMPIRWSFNLVIICCFVVTIASFSSSGTSQADSPPVGLAASAEPVSSEAYETLISLLVKLLAKLKEISKTTPMKTKT